MAIQIIYNQKRGIVLLDTTTHKYVTDKVIVFSPTFATYEFPFHLATVGHVSAKYGFYTKRTERMEAFLIYTVSGAGKMTWHNETVDLTPQSICLIDCKDYQYYRTISKDEPWVHYYVHFNGSGINGYAPYLLDHLHNQTVKNPQRIAEIFEYLLSGELRNDPLSNSRGCLLLTELLNSLMEERYDLNFTVDDPNYQALRPAYEYIKANYATQITVDVLSEKCCLSKYYFIHLFKKATGKTPYQYITHYRMNKAKYYLSNSNFPIEEIAHTVGYANYSNFESQFRKLTDSTPLQYRNALRVRNLSVDDIPKTYRTNPES